MKAHFTAFLLTTSAVWSVANVETVPTHDRNLYRLTVVELDGHAGTKKSSARPMTAS